MAVAGLLLVLLVTSVSVAFHNADATALAMATARSSPVFVDRVGQPATVGWIITGGIEVSAAFGHAELSIPVSGPKGKGTLYAMAVKRAGIWSLTFLQYGADGDSSRLDLLTH